MTFKQTAAVTPLAPSSNWNALKKSLRPTSATSSNAATTSLKRRRSSLGESSSSKIDSRKLSFAVEVDDESVESAAAAAVAGAGGKVKGKGKGFIPVESILKGGGSAGYQAGAGQFLAMDCEMVGVGPEGSESTLARVSIVNYHGATILDRFVRPRERVTDYRTWVSGVREEDLRNAPSFVEVQKEVADLIKDRILVGHALTNDTQVLLLSHPRSMTRDTAHYAPLQGLAKTKKPGLKTLAKLVLGVDIQTGEHSSVDDARTTMAIYRSQKSNWEPSLRPSASSSSSSSATNSKPSLLTTSTPTLYHFFHSDAATTGALEGAREEIKGVKKSNKPKHLGLAATIRAARAVAESVAAGAKKVMGVEEAEEREGKKRRREEEDGLVLGFDYTVREKPIVLPAMNVVKKAEKKEVNSKVGEEVIKKKRRDPKRRISGDEGKRPKSSDGWWVD